MYMYMSNFFHSLKTGVEIQKNCGFPVSVWPGFPINFTVGDQLVMG